MRGFRLLVAALVAVLAGALALPAEAAEPSPHWVGAWQASPEAGGPASDDKSYRLLVHPSVGGSAIRLRFSNSYGAKPVTLTDVQVGFPTGDTPGPAVQAASLRQATFHGRKSVTLPVGSNLYSDPVPLVVGDQEWLSVSFFAPGSDNATTYHNVGITTSYTTADGAGDHASEALGTAFTTPTISYTYLEAVDVVAASTVSTVVALGDSITDCCYEVPDTNKRWPDLLNERFAAAPGGQRFSVVNAGIVGNDVSNDRDGTKTQGEAGYTRVVRDVLDEPNVSTLILFEGINDIGTGSQQPAISTAYLSILRAAHARGIRVIIATLTPCKDAIASGDLYVSNAPARVEVNAWIVAHRTLFDGLVRFDKAVQDPVDPEGWLPAYTVDELHPNPLGLVRLANAFDLRQFTSAVPAAVRQPSAASPARAATPTATVVRDARPAVGAGRLATTGPDALLAGCASLALGSAALLRRRRIPPSRA